MSRHSLERPKINMDTAQSLLTKGSIMLITTYDSSLPSPCTVASPFKATRSPVLGKSETALFSSAGAPKLSGIITEQHGDNWLLRN